MKRQLILALLVISLFLVSGCINGEPKVTRIIDGDTFEMSNGDIVRMVCIDTRERGEKYYSEASDYLSDLILNKKVELIKDVSDEDRYGRKLRYVELDGVDINEQMVRSGFAKVYRYSPDTARCDTYELAENKAKEEELNIWSSTYAEIESSYTDYPVCSTNTYNCEDFITHNEAQAVFETCGGVDNDIHILDRDGDGVACEALP